MPEGTVTVLATAPAVDGNLRYTNNNLNSIIINTGTTGPCRDLGAKSKTGVLKRSKPDMEKRRRARINASLAELKALIPDSVRKNKRRFSKLEKADILEMAVQYMRVLHGNNKERSQLSSKSYSLGFSECAQEVTQFLQNVPAPGCPATSQLKTRLLDHLSGCAPHQVPDSPSRSQKPGDITNNSVNSDHDLASSSLVARYLMSDPPLPSMHSVVSGFSDRKSQVTPIATVSSTSDDVKVKENIGQNNIPEDVVYPTVDDATHHNQSVQDELSMDDQMDITESPVQQIQQERYPYTRKEPSNLIMTGNLAEIHHARRSLLAEFEHATTGQQAFFVGSNENHEPSHQDHFKQDKTQHNQNVMNNSQKNSSEQGFHEPFQYQDNDRQSQGLTSEEVPCKVLESYGAFIVNTQIACGHVKNNNDGENKNDSNRQLNVMGPGVQIKDTNAPSDVGNRCSSQSATDFDANNPGNNYTKNSMNEIITVADKNNNKNVKDPRHNIVNGNTIDINNTGTNSVISTHNNEKSTHTQQLSKTEDHNYFRRVDDTTHKDCKILLSDNTFTKGSTSMSTHDPILKSNKEQVNAPALSFPTNTSVSCQIISTVTCQNKRSQEISDFGADTNDLPKDVFENSNLNPNDKTESDYCTRTVSQEKSNTYYHCDSGTSTLPAAQGRCTTSNEAPSTQSKQTSTISVVTSTSPIIQNIPKPSQLKTISSVLIPIFVQTSFCAGELKTFQQAFLVKRSKDAGNTAVSSCTGKANSTTRKLTPIAPKLAGHAQQLALSKTSGKLDTLDGTHNMLQQPQASISTSPVANSKPDQISASPLSNNSISNSNGNKQSNRETFLNPPTNKDTAFCKTVQRSATVCRSEENKPTFVLSTFHEKDHMAIVQPNENELIPHTFKEHQKVVQRGELVQTILHEKLSTDPVEDCCLVDSGIETRKTIDESSEDNKEFNGNTFSNGNDHHTARDLEHKLSTCKTIVHQTSSPELTRSRTNSDASYFDGNLEPELSMQLKSTSPGIGSRTKTCNSHHTFGKLLSSQDFASSGKLCEGSYPQVLRNGHWHSTEVPEKSTCLTEYDSCNILRDEGREATSTLRYLNEESSPSCDVSVSNDIVYTAPVWDKVAEHRSSQPKLSVASQSLQNSKLETIISHEKHHSFLRRGDVSGNHTVSDGNTKRYHNSATFLGTTSHNNDSNVLGKISLHSGDSNEQKKNILMKSCQIPQNPPTSCPQIISNNYLSSPIPRKRAYTISGENTAAHLMTSAQRKYRVDHEQMSVGTEPKIQATLSSPLSDLNANGYEDILTAALRCNGPVNREFLLARRRCASFSAQPRNAPHLIPLNKKEESNCSGEQVEDNKSVFYPKSFSEENKEDISLNTLRQGDEERQNFGFKERRSQKKAESTTLNAISKLHNGTNDTRSCETYFIDKTKRSYSFSDTCVKATQSSQAFFTNNSGQHNLDQHGLSRNSNYREHSINQCGDMYNNFRVALIHDQHEIREDKPPSCQQTRNTHIPRHGSLDGNDIKRRTNSATANKQRSILSSWNTAMKTPEKLDTNPTTLHPSRQEISSNRTVPQSDQPLNLSASSHSLTPSQTEISEPLNLTTTKKPIESQRYACSSYDCGSKLHTLGKQLANWDDSLESYPTYEQHSSAFKHSFKQKIIKDSRFSVPETPSSPTNDYSFSSFAMNGDVKRGRSFSMTSRLSSLSLDQWEPHSTLQNCKSQGDTPEGLHDPRIDEENVWRPWSSCFS